MSPLTNKKAISDRIFIPFNDACILFDEVEQSVLILNHTATFIWCASVEMNSYDELLNLVARTFSISVEHAQQDIEQFYDNFQTNCLFLPKEDELNSFLKPIDNTPCHPCDTQVEALYLLVHQKAFKLLTATMALRIELLRIYSHFICTPEDFKQAEKKYSVEVCSDINTDVPLFFICIDKQCVIKGLFIEGVVPYVFGIVFENTWRAEAGTSATDKHTIENTPGSLMFHAAVLAQDHDKTILFPAESGAGKSTLAALLSAQGWHFFTDELAIIIPRTFEVIPCPFPVCVKKGAVAFLSACYPQLAGLIQHHRLDGKKVRYLLVEKPVLTSAPKAKISALVFPCYDIKINCELQVLDKAEALARFLNCGSSGRDMLADELSSVVKMIEKLPCYSLNYSDTDKAIAQIESLVMSL